MSTLSFTLRDVPARQVNLSALIPSRLAGLSLGDIEKLAIGSGEGALTVGDVFAVSGTPGDSLVISGSSPQFDFVGGGLDDGTVVVEGSVGNLAGRGMTGGKLEIQGDAGAFLGSTARGGLIHVKGSAGDFAGGIWIGDKFGMLGGIAVVEGNVGARAGERMRRGTIIARGAFGPAAGSRMVGGTLWTESGFGAGPGPLLRRGTLIAPKVDSFLPTFSDCGWHDLVVLNILSRYVTQTLGALAPKPLPPKVRKFAGDRATIGKGEILLTS